MVLIIKQSFHRFCCQTLKSKSIIVTFAQLGAQLIWLTSGAYWPQPSRGGRASRILSTQLRVTITGITPLCIQQSCNMMVIKLAVQSQILLVFPVSFIEYACQILYYLITENQPSVDRYACQISHWVHT